MALGSPFFEQLTLKIAQNFTFGSLCSTLVPPSNTTTVKTIAFPLMRNIYPKSSGRLCVLKFTCFPT